MSNSMKLWEAVSVTDPSHTKPAKLNGMNITAIDPHYQRMNATKMFGPYGIGWGIIPESENVIYRKYDDIDLACYTATMFYIYEGNRGEFPINSNIKVSYIVSGKNYLKVDDDFMKKLQTDALTKGLSFLGFNADVFMGLFDDNKYVQEVSEKIARNNEVQSQKEYDKFVAENIESIESIQIGLDTGDLSAAKESWDEFSQDEKQLLWKAPSKGGCFTTEQRRIMQTPEFREANK